MAGYLESYAAIEERKARNRQRLKLGIILTVCALIVAAILFVLFRNYPEEQLAKTFLRDLQSRQYQQAYRMFGCSDQNPCRDYAFGKFLEDWGPNSPYADAANARIAMVESCGSSSYVRLEFPKAEPVALMVDRSTSVVSFAPSNWIECPGRHWHIWQFIKGLFGH